MSENGNAYFNYSVLKSSKAYKESQHGSIRMPPCVAVIHISKYFADTRRNKVGRWKLSLIATL